MLGDNPQTIRGNAEILLEASKAIGLEVNPEKTKYMIMSRDQNIVRNGTIKIGDLSFEEVEKFKYLGATSSVKKSDRISKTVILPVVLYGCETWALTLREEQKLRVFENKVLRKIFGAKRDEVTGEWRKLHNAELHALYTSPDIIRNIKSRRLRWAGHVARMVASKSERRKNGAESDQEEMGHWLRRNSIEGFTGRNGKWEKVSGQKVEKFKYLGATVTNINGAREEIERGINMGNACYYSVEKLLSSSLLSKKLKVRIYKTVILPVVLYGCETWTITLREEQRLRVFENKVPRKIFGAKKDEVTGEWRKLHNAELHALHSTPDIIKNIKSRRLRLAFRTYV
ncbi:hypothetical protein ANN_05906 [Periplaneta americana]|uniref:Reverse transcriptase domain-containing protein n=1 Tax=Periplaneta americana TaxID=6978 RepID=A0ABQ8TC31_PERAM|nr:hypothetical protein ANN_05906 [Periplaneta americana]